MNEFVPLRVVRLLVAFAALAMIAVPRGADAHTKELTKADVDRLFKELSNWGRWGDQDQLGTINLITPANRTQAAALVKEGVSVSLARNVEKQMAVDNGSPFQQVMLRASASLARLNDSRKQCPCTVSGAESCNCHPRGFCKKPLRHSASMAPERRASLG